MPFIEFRNRKLLFVHIPKTGGTSIENWWKSVAPLRLYTLGVPAPLKVTPQHLTYSEIGALFGKGYFDYAFAIVRNPYERLASEYRMKYLIAKKENFFGGFMPFPMWLERHLTILKTNPYVLDAHLRPQSRFIGEAVKVFKFEEGLDTIFSKIAAETGLPLPQNPIKELSSKEFDGEIIWDTHEIELVREAYMRDFKMFDYNVHDVPTSRQGPPVKKTNKKQ